jgi:hypothetical protein
MKSLWENSKNRKTQQQSETSEHLFGTYDHSFELESLSVRNYHKPRYLEVVTVWVSDNRTDDRPVIQRLTGDRFESQQSLGSSSFDWFTVTSVGRGWSRHARYDRDPGNPESTLNCHPPRQNHATGTKTITESSVKG